LCYSFTYNETVCVYQVMAANLAREHKAAPEVNRKGDFLLWVQKVIAESQVYVFGPDGSILSLSRGATLVDVVRRYARAQYKSKSKAQAKMSREKLRGFRVNGQRALLGRVLRNGDVISL
jgi:(p)ppGpp synthase/HD superfamily hydrolase